MLSLHNRQCSAAEFAPQALPPAGTRLTQDPRIYSSFDGGRVNFAHVSRNIHRTTRFPSDRSSAHLGLYNASLACNSGSANVDNVCLCPNSLDSMPFNLQPPATTAYLTKHLFSPFESVPELTPSARKLIAERSPLPPGVSAYRQLDAPPT